MKKISAILSFTALLLCGCTVSELNDGRTDSPVFTASFEEMPGTKTYVDSDLYMYWNADDRLSIFTTTYNQQYRFSGKTGDNGGDFEEVAAGGFHSGNSISTNYAVYPYSSTTSLSKDEKISLTMPAVQDYAEGSFGLRASTMVAVTAGPSDYFLAFKNLCGFLVVKLYGEGSVKSVSIKGNNGEKLAGSATVTASHGSAPTLAFGDDATETITIDCGAGVALGSDASHATEFWFCIPPVSFSKGFTITVTDTKGCSMEKSTSTSREVERNIKTSMAALPAVFESDNESSSIIDIKIPYICSSQIIKVPFEPFSSFVIDNLNITYTTFLRDYSVDGSSTGGTQYSAVVYVKDSESGKMVDSEDKYADISFDSAFPPEYPITITISHAQVGQIGEQRDLYIKFSDEYSKEEVWVPITISVAPPAIFDFGMNKIANEWYTEIDGERSNTVKVFVRIPSSTEDDVMDCSRDIDHYYIAYNPSISLSDYADDVYKARSEDGKTLKYASALQTRYEYSFSEIQPKVSDYQLGLRTGKDGKVTDYHNLYAFDSRGNELGLVASLVGETKHEKLVYSTSEIAKKILNMYPFDSSDQMQMVYANIHVDIYYGSCDILAGSEDFHARFLRPINIAWNSPEAVVAGSTGNANINVADFISGIKDWNNQAVVRKATASDNVPEGQTLVENVIKWSMSINLYKYYQFKSLVVDLKNVKRDGWKVGDSAAQELVSKVTPAAKLTIGDKTNEPVEIDIKDIAKLNDVVVNYNLDEPFLGTFNLYFPVKVVYSWGEIDDIVKVTLQYDDSAEIVDLGLSVKWATCNLGASSPEEYGDYYQWGGLEDVTDTSIYLGWDNCPYHTGFSYTSGFTKYVLSGCSSYWSGTGNPDNKTVLDPDDDVAHVKLGGKWRMPTKAEYDELINNCQCDWVTYNGVSGRKFTSKIAGYTDKWIFLPAAGYRSYDSLLYVGSYGGYWSSSLDTDYPAYACYLYFVSEEMYTCYGSRCYGQSVRPVCE